WQDEYPKADRGPAGEEGNRFVRFFKNLFAAPASLSDSQLEKFASAAELPPADLRILRDNDVAFQNKIDLIRGARESIDLAYYIYTDDYSSSYLSRELLRAANDRGVRVRLLLDYHSSYKYLDLFTMLERESGGKIQVRFYGRPTKHIIMDAAYLTTGCGADIKSNNPTACQETKLQEFERQFARYQNTKVVNHNTGGSGLFLSGLYSKDPEVMGLAVLNGQGIDPKALASGAPSSPEQKEQLKKLAKLFWDSKTGSFPEALVARIQLYMAFQLYGDQLNPLSNTLTGIIPLSVSNSPSYKSSEASRIKEWQHLTDFLHHKLLFVDKRALQLGGRNIEDSYHMRQNALTKKYIFVDTDLALALNTQNGNAGGEKIEGAFTNLWNFSEIVAPISEVREHAPNDVVANLDIKRTECAEAAAAAGKKERAETKAFVKNCMAQKAEQPGKSLEERLAAAKATLEQNADIYVSEYLRPNEPDIQAKVTSSLVLDESEKSQAQIAYLENLPFQKNRVESDAIRGAKDGQAAKYGKYIHEVWARAMFNVCETSAQSGVKQEIILHNAYFFPSSNLLAAFANMTDGSIDCSNVTLKILTNSFTTTDLNVINIVADHSMKALFEYMAEFRHQRSAKVVLLEHAHFSDNKDAHFSLHSKVAIYGDSDLFVGSANADVRSYMMDSNNGIYVRNAPGLVAKYKNELSTLVSDTKKIRDVTSVLIRKNRAQMVAQNLEQLRAIMTKYGLQNKLSPEQIKGIETRIQGILQSVYDLSKASIRNWSSPAERNEFLVNPNANWPQRKLRDRALQIESQNRLDGLYQAL
ncbi:MAG TPA: phospholipase D-like domain-containing protein, partial [Bdellovibrionales bacterium]|nr:phospholipase D-like domain-containing protein [Bdellovibrionales bacterium]